MIEETEMILRSNLSVSSKLVGVYFYALRLFDEKSPTYKEISEGLRISRTTAIKCVKELVDGGFLVKNRDPLKMENIFYGINDVYQSKAG